MIPRYDLTTFARKLVGGSVVVTGSAIDATSLLHYSNLFLGGGGTMTAEAALLGVPSISFYPGPPTYVESYLMRLGLVARIGSIRAIVRHAIRILDDPSYEKASRAKSKSIISKMEDPIAVIEKYLK